VVVTFQKITDTAKAVF